MPPPSPSPPLRKFCPVHHALDAFLLGSELRTYSTLASYIRAIDTHPHTHTHTHMLSFLMRPVSSISSVHLSILSTVSMSMHKRFIAKKKNKKNVLHKSRKSGRDIRLDRQHCVSFCIWAKHDSANAICQVCSFWIFFFRLIFLMRARLATHTCKIWSALRRKMTIRSDNANPHQRGLCALDRPDGKYNTYGSGVITVCR